MKYLVNDNVNPAWNHAMEEYFLKDTQEQIFTLWRNRRTLLLGRNQDAYSEVDISFARENDIRIVRRLSGGGTVYCDLNNMQYSFITDLKNGENSFAHFAKPVVEALKNLGLDAEFTGRNDILLDGKKISGNAQYRYKNRILHHGTLLFDIDTALLGRALQHKPIKFEQKNVKSVSSRVGNIKDYVAYENVTDFMDYLVKYIVDFCGIEEILNVEDTIRNGAEKYLSRFEDESWNLGSPNRASIPLSKKYAYGLVEYHVRWSENVLRELKIQGDFFQDRDVRQLERMLVGHSESELRPLLEQTAVDEFIKGMDSETLLNDLLSTGR